MKRVVIIGAAGYVGLELANQLRGSNFEVNAVTRENGKFLLRNSGFNVVVPSDIGSVGEADVVVNLAHPTSGPPQQYPARNKEILDQIKATTGPRSRLIHVSTQAVFGNDLDRPIHAGPVPMVRDFPYNEAKIELENMVLDEFGSKSVQILRLGNVWGPGSPTWTVTFINKILFGEPVGIESLDGYCNATDVANVASYLHFLINSDHLLGAHFYHLAEMSEHRWSEWVHKIESALSQEAVLVPDFPNDPDSLRDEVREALSPLRPEQLYRNLATRRISGSRIRGLIRGMGQQRFERAKKRYGRAFPSGYALGPSEKIFLKLVSCQTQFKTQVLEQWEPPIDFGKSWSNVEDWMSDAGYTLCAR